MFIIIKTETHVHNKSCCDVYAPKILYLATTNSSKCGLKNSTKLQKSKGSAIDTKHQVQHQVQVVYIERFSTKESLGEHQRSYHGKTRT